MNKVWTRICPILGLLLLRGVIPLLSVQVVSDCLFCEPSNNQSTSKCVSVNGCNFSPDEDRGALNAVLSTHTEHVILIKLHKKNLKKLSLMAKLISIMPNMMTTL